ncbi:MAG: peptidoglycan-binding protein LysM [Chromatiales bacterium]|jgi:nucleoid-associated protein YgaU|nr:peptidoglycan-binding protein LysM [Chromatiales bacterium]MDH3931373.1 peptidoglycan-binding protein LysM [Chromatiales bacterium]MDH4014183.1 peptidoglycan-binding protein LysM [Chromatiales bacterium]PLX57634.1 MAG: peptidoglycan-binding protein LysM [Chromatiales bacterium]
MGLFDFARDIGRKLFDTDAEAADNIKEHLNTSLSGVTNLDVKFDDGVVTLCGDCAKASTKELAVLMAGNVEGVKQVIADELTAPPPPPEVKVEYYEIQRGDTLSGIAKKYYGDPMQYKALFEANREVIEDPDKIYPGQKIRIPKKTAN